MRDADRREQRDDGGDQADDVQAADEAVVGGVDDLRRRRAARPATSRGDADRLADVVLHLREQRVGQHARRACRSSSDVKWLAISEPKTATPTAPPIWRVVSFTAEPTPALARGSEPMIESVQGAMTLRHADGPSAS